MKKVNWDAVREQMQDKIPAILKKLEQEIDENPPIKASVFINKSTIVEISFWIEYQEDLHQDRKCIPYCGKHLAELHVNERDLILRIAANVAEVVPGLQLFPGAKANLAVMVFKIGPKETFKQKRRY